jgi:hypothetical protein
MNTSRLRALLSLASLLTLASCDTINSYMKPKYQISVHVQAERSDSPREIMNVPLSGETLTFRKVPEFGQGSIAAFESFPAEDGSGNGLLLKLDAHGRNMLENVTRLHQGEMLLSIVNGVPVDVVQIDQPLVDGRFTIWRGVAEETVVNMDKKLVRISGLKSSSRIMDMTASTSKEKREARRAAQEEKKYLEDMARRAERGEDVAAPPRTKEIPLE